jgi:hypothetical protein
VTHEVAIDTAGGAAAFSDGPDDQRLTALHVAGGKVYPTIEIDFRHDDYESLTDSLVTAMI